MKSLSDELELISGKLAIVKAAVEDIDKKEAELSAKKNEYIHQLDVLENEYKLKEGQIFAEECKEGKHPVIAWDCIPQYMRNDLHDISQNLFAEMHPDIDPEQITEKMTEESILEAIKVFKQKYNIENITLC